MLSWPPGRGGGAVKPGAVMCHRHVYAARKAALTAVLLCAFLGGGLRAQDQRAVGDTALEPAAASGAQLAEVIVTADRREESNQRVPLAISVVTAEAAQRLGITDAQSLADLVPGLIFDRQADASIPYLRGVGTPVGQAGDEPSVALYVDDVYMPSGSASIANFNSIDRIEVEKGPQGTLFGRNATGGVVQVYTRNPSPDPKIEVRLGYGNYDTGSGDIYASGPLTEELLANVAAYWSDQAEGWGRNATTGVPTFKSRDYGGRAKFLWTPAAHTSALLSIDFDKTIAQQGVGFEAWPGTGSLDPLPPLPNGGFEAAPGYYDLREDFASGDNDRQYGTSLKLAQSFDSSRLVSISAYRDILADYRVDQDLGPLPIVNAAITTEETTFTQELQLLSPRHARNSWIAGLYYFDDKAGFEPITFTGSAFAPFSSVDPYGIQTTRSWAIYVQETAAISPNTHLTAGGRYTQDERSMRAGAVFGESAFVRSSNSPQSSRWSSPTWRLVLDHRLTADMMAYLGYNRGFKSGIYNLVVLPGAPIDRPVDPEKLDAYTAGLKSEYLNHRLRVNVEGFYYDYRNIQVEEILSGVTHITNAAKATIKGVDLDVSVMPVDRLTLNLALEELQGRYDSFPDGAFFVYDPATGGNCTFSVAPGPAPVPCGGTAMPPNYDPTTGHWDLKGNHTIRTPPLSASLTALYEIPTAIGEFDLNLSWMHSGSYFASPDNGKGQIPPSSSGNTMQHRLELVNGSVGWESSSSLWRARLWVRNLTGVKYWSESDQQEFGTQYSPAAPRTFGVTVGMRFE